MEQFENSNEADDDKKVVSLLRKLLPAIVSIAASNDQVADTEFDELVDQAASGDRTAVDKLRNPWRTSETKKSAIPRVRAKQKSGRDAVYEHLPPLIAAYFALKDADEILWDHKQSSRQKAISDASGQRFLDLYVENGGTDRALDRASKETIAAIAADLKEKAAYFPKPDTDLLDRLKGVGLLEMVCATERSSDWLTLNITSADRAQFAGYDPRYVRGAPTFRVVPTQIVMDPVRLPRHHSDWKWRYMTNDLWDNHGSSSLFKIFPRCSNESEVEGKFSEQLTLPPVDDLDQMKSEDEQFKEELENAESTAARLSALRTLYKKDIWLRCNSDSTGAETGNGVEFEPLGYGYVSSQGDQDDEDLSDIRTVVLDEVIQEIINFSAAQRDVILDDAAWESWKSWGTVLLALDNYLRDSNYLNGLGEGPWEHYQTLVWLYLLKGRLCQTDKSLPPPFRKFLFDWLELPVSFSERYALRYLVPVEALTGKMDDSDEAYKERLARASWKRPSRN